MNTCIHYVLNILNYTMGLGKKQVLLISKAWKNMTGQSHPVPYTGRSKNSAKIMQDLYDGVYISMPTGKPEVSNSDYLAIETLYGTKEGEAKRGIFESIVNKYMGYFLNGVDKEDRKIGVTKVLDDSYVNSTTYLFNPSFHVTDTENKNSSALDIRTYSPYTDTAAKFYDQHLALGYGGYRGSDHNHMSYRWKT